MADETQIETEVARLGSKDEVVPDSATTNEEPNGTAVESVIEEEEEGEWVAISESQGKIDKDKKFKKLKKDKKRTDDKPTIAEIVFAQKKVEPEPKLVLDGVKTVKLTHTTQKLIGCIVGQQVTSESPWITIDRSLVDEDMELQEENSDFHCIKDDLVAYANVELMVGYDADFEPDASEEYHRFYVVVKEEAKQKITHQLCEERRLHEERLKSSINKPVRPWTTLGSGREVDDSIPVNKRPLIQLELEADVDELLRPFTLHDRDIEESKDGYVKIGPGRAEFQGVRKICIDTAVQAVPPVDQGAAQTDPGLPVNVWTQYVYDIDSESAAVGDEPEKGLELSFADAEKQYLFSALEYNETFDLYLNDYPLLVLNEDDAKVPRKKVFEEYQSYTDVPHCKGKFISNIAWHPMRTGTVALSYVHTVKCTKATEINRQVDETTRQVFTRNLVLVWSFSDSLKPKLKLESPREINKIAWCPTNSNLLLGGSASGQIAIWDLTGKLSDSKQTEILNADQQKCRLVMHGLLGWLKEQQNVKYIGPTAQSHLLSSHVGRVTCLQWMTPYHRITDLGMFLNVTDFSLHCITCGEDGCIKFWDLKRLPGVKTDEKKVKKKKGRKRPPALMVNISRYKEYDRAMCPVYQIAPAAHNEANISLFTGIVAQSYVLKYELDVAKDVTEKPQVTKADVIQELEGEEKIKKETDIEQTEPKEEHDTILEEEDEEEDENDVEQKSKKTGDDMEEEKMKQVDPEVKKAMKPENEVRRTMETPEIYRPIFAENIEQPLKSLFVTNELGETLTVKWEGFEFQKGEKITTDPGTVTSCGRGFHDGAIIKCARSPFFSEYCLTVGGTVFAVWKDTLKDKPILWKHDAIRKTTCCWSPYRPSMFHIGRADGSLEVWDLLVRSDKPILVQSISGQALTAMDYHTLPLPGGRNILAVGDFNNSLRLLYFPLDYQVCKPDDLQRTSCMLEKHVSVLLSYDAWSDSFLKIHADELKKQKAEEEAIALKIQMEEEAIEAELQARAKLEADEAKRLRGQRTTVALFNEKIGDKLKHDQEQKMIRVLMEKKGLNKAELLAKQEPVVNEKQREQMKREKQQKKIQQQNRIFDKTVGILFPEMMEKAQEETSLSDQLDSELSQLQSVLMEEYSDMEAEFMKYLNKNPFNQRFKWEKVFEEGKSRRNVLDFPLFVRKKRTLRYNQKKKQIQQAAPSQEQKRVSKRSSRVSTRSVAFADEEGSSVISKSSIFSSGRSSLGKDRKKSSETLTRLRRSVETLKEREYVEDEEVEEEHKETFDEIPA